MDNIPALRVFDAARALAFMGDLSMGQPTDHSTRTAWIADNIAAAENYGEVERGVVRQAALLRWSGCTSNAAGFADILGDDVAGREAMLAMRPKWSAPLVGGVGVTITPLAQIHCEVSGEVARMLGLDASTEATLRHIFEAYDGNGVPDGLRGEAIPASVFVVTLAGDIEIFSRVYGLDQALVLIEQRAGITYPARLAQTACARARLWLEALDRKSPAEIESALLTEAMSVMTSAELVGDVSDLKFPWMTGFSRQVAQDALACALRLGLSASAQSRVYLAGLIHGIGRASLSNRVWGIPGPLPESAWEKVRLIPYWTSRLGKQIAALEREAEIASYAYERLDGSGYFRGLSGQAIGVEGRILAVAVALAALRSRRPWRAAFSDVKAATLLSEDAVQGRFDPEIVRLMTAAITEGTGKRERTSGTLLSARETEVLRWIGQGASNKQIARELDLSPSTVRTHVESVFRKLGCSTRAAATLKASTIGLL